MSKTIKLNTGPEHSGTFFDGLEVALHEWKGHRLAQIEKTFWFADRRYNPVRREWKLDQLLTILRMVESYGPLTPSKDASNHGSFTVVEDSPIQFVEVKEDRGGVFLNNWAFHPLYRFEEFSSLVAAVAMLSDVQSYLDNLPPPLTPDA